MADANLLGIVAASGAMILAGTMEVLRPGRAERLLDRPVVLAGALALLWTLPFWIGGPNSLVPGGDEAAAGVTGYLLRDRFAGYAGGVFGGSEITLLQGNGVSSFLSLERMLFHYLPLWLAILILKLLATALAFIGGYRLALAAKAGRRVSTICGLWAAVPGFFFMTSITWGLSVIGMPLAVYVVVGRLQLPRRAYWGGVLALVLLWPLSHLPTQTLPALVTALFGGAALLGFGRLVRLLGAVTLLSVVLVGNWSGFLLGLSKISAEMGRVISKDQDAVAGKFLYVFGKLDHVRPLLPPVFIIMALCGRRRFILHATVYAAVIGMAFILQFFPWEAVWLEFLNGFNFQYIVIALVPLSIISLAEALTLLEARFPGHLASAAQVLAAGGVIALGLQLFIPSAVSMVGVHGQKGLFAIPNLVDRPWHDDNCSRAVAFPNELTPSVIATYGIPTFDGYANTLPGRQRAYWDLGISRQLDTTASFHGAVSIMEFPALAVKSHDVTAVADLNLLEAASVSWIISRFPLDTKGLEWVSGPAALEQKPAGLMDRVVGRLTSVATPDPAYVYRLPGSVPLVYLAQGMRVSSSSFQDPAFYKDLAAHVRARTATLEQGGVVPPIDPGPARLHAVVYRDGRLEAEVDAAGNGLLVYAVVHSFAWTVTVDGRPAAMVAIDGVKAGIPFTGGHHRIAVERRLVHPFAGGPSDGQVACTVTEVR